MRVLGIDFGTKTLGLAISDNTKTIATSLKTLRYEKNYKDIFDELKDIINKNNVDEIVLGYPINMNDTIGERAESTLSFKKELEEFLCMNVVLEDERLTTQEATNILLEADMSRKKRKKLVDKIAASFILQSYLDRRKNGQNYY